MFNVILNRCDLIVAAVDFNGVPVQETTRYRDSSDSTNRRHFKKSGHRVRQVEPVSSPGPKEPQPNQALDIGLIVIISFDSLLLSLGAHPSLSKWRRNSNLRFLVSTM